MAPIAARCRYSSSVVHVLESIFACETVKRGSLADRGGETSTMLARVPKRCEQGTGRMLLPAAQCAACRVAVRGCYELASCLTRACAHQISPGERDGDPSLTAFPKSQRAAALRWSSVSTKKQKKGAGLNNERKTPPNNCGPSYTGPADRRPSRARPHAHTIG